MDFFIIMIYNIDYSKCVYIQLSYKPGTIPNTVCILNFFQTSNFIFCVGVYPINNAAVVSGEREGTQPSIYMWPFSPKPFPSRLPYSAELISMCYTVSPCLLSILNIAVYTTYPNSLTIPFPRQP